MLLVVTVLGEFGHHIAEEPGSSYSEQLAILQSKFSTVGSPTKGIVLSAYIKLRNNDPSLGPQVIEALRSCCSHIDQEVQQRACEYVMFTGLSDGNPELLPTVFEAMDFFPDRDNPLVQRLLDAAVHGLESDHVLSKKREKTTAIEGGVEEDGGAGGAPPMVAPPPEPEPEPEPVDAVGDLLGLDMEAAAPPLTPRGDDMRQSQPPPVGDSVASPPIAHLGSDMTGAQQGQQGIAVGVLPPSFEPRVTAPETVYQNAQVRDKFRVFADNQIDIGCVLAVDAAAKRATVTFFAGNKSETQTMSNFQIRVAPSAELQVFETSPAPPIFGPKKQEQHAFQAQCSAPYLTAPVARVTYLVQGTERTIEFTFPLYAATRNLFRPTCDDV